MLAHRPRGRRHHAHVQEMLGGGAAVLATGRPDAIGAFAVSAQLSLSNPSGASTAVVSVPFDKMHKMHDLAMAAVDARRRRLIQGQDMATTLVPYIMESVQQPRANIVLLQVRVSAEGACFTRESLHPPSCTGHRNSPQQCKHTHH